MSSKIKSKTSIPTRRKVIAITGARSEYDILYPVLLNLSKSSNANLELIVCGPHLSERYGNTVDVIEKDNFKIVEKINNFVEGDSRIARISSLGNLITPLASALHKHSPDVLLVVGDREEAISTAMVGAFLGIPVAHIAGGDVAHDGNIDNSTRYATSKYAHIHFTLLPQHSETLLRLGEDPWRIFCFGNPAIDRLVNTPKMSLENLSKAIEWDVASSPFAIISMHPIVSDPTPAEDQVKIVADVVKQIGIRCLVNCPNSDAQSLSMIAALNQYFADTKQFKLFKNLSREVYVNLLRNARCLIGNSSSGILEGPSLGLPVVNIGKRQRGRPHGDNVIFIDFDYKQISDAISKSISDEEYRRDVELATNPYGDGKSGERIAEKLIDFKITPELIFKNITY